jgi:hypothetical protein
MNCVAIVKPTFVHNASVYFYPTLFHKYKNPTPLQTWLSPKDKGARSRGIGCIILIIIFVFERSKDK